MVLPPTIAVSGCVAVLQLIKDIYLKWQAVKRFRDDCKELAHFVTRIEGFLMETEDDEDMTEPGWQAAFTALHEALLAVGEVFDDCARYGIVRSLVNADEMNLRLSSIAQRMTMALQLIPIQKAKAMDRRLRELQELQHEIHTATFAAARAAEQQSARLKRLMDQSRVDNSKTHEMLEQVLLLLQQDAGIRSSAAAAAACPPSFSDGPPPAACGLYVPPDKLAAEVEDLRAEMELAQRDKKILEEQYIAQIIAAIEAVAPLPPAADGDEPGTSPSSQQQQPAADDPDEVPSDLLCPITYQLLDDPVIVVESGQTYDRAAIEEWLGRGNKKDPVSGVELESCIVAPNLLVRKQAKEWLEQHPGYRAKAAAASAAAAMHDAGFALKGGSRAARQASFDASGTAAAAGKAAKGQQQQAAGLAGAAAGNSSSSSSQGWLAGLTACQRAAADESEEFQLNPQAAALLASVEEAAAAARKGFGGSGFSTPGGAAGASSSGPRGQQQHQYGSGSSSSRAPAQVDLEKAAAQRAYAASVGAAAAAAPQAAVPVYAAMAAAGGGPLAPAGFAGPGPGPARPHASSSSSSGGHGGPLYRTIASTAGQPNQRNSYDSDGVDAAELADAFDPQLQALGNSSSRRASLSLGPVAASGGSGSSSSSSFSFGGSQQQQVKGGVTLSDFRSTFGRMADTRSKMSVRYGASKTQQQELQQQQQEQAADAGATGLHSLDRQGSSGSSGSAGGGSGASFVVHPSAASVPHNIGRPASGPVIRAVSDAAALSAASRQQQQQHRAGGPDVPPQRSVSAAAVLAGGGSSSGKSAGGGGGLFGFGRRKKSAAGEGEAGGMDDTASVSSDGSSSYASSRKSGRMLNVLKSISYTMKYDDEKC